VKSSFALFALAALALGQTAPPKPAPAKSAAAPSYKDLKFPTLREVKIPTPESFVLPNGMKVFLLEEHELPLVRGVALVRTGNLFDPPDKRGLSEIAALVLRSGGTKARTGDQIDEQLENIAASVESGMDETSASVSFSGLKQNTDDVLAAFKEILTSPEFRQDKLDLALTQTRSAIARRNDDPSGIPDRELASIVYGRNTPYGWQIEYEHLARIHRDDLIQFYRRYYFPKNIQLAVYGDFSAAEMKAKLEKLFADWKVEQPAVPPFPGVTAKPAPGVYFAQKDDVTQSFFAVGELGGTLRDKDYAALQVASNILGMGFNSRLVKQIRTKLGYAYDIAAVWSAGYNEPGTFRIVGSTKSASTTETMQAIAKEIDLIRTQEVTPEELETAKQSTLNSFVFYFDSPAKTLNRVMRYEYFDYPKDFLFQYQKAVAAVTRADVLRVARDRFKMENMSIVVVGNAKDFGKPLDTLGKVSTIDLTIPEPKTESAKSDAASAARGKALLAKMQQAAGGAEKLAAVADSTQVAEMALTPENGGMRLKQENKFIAPSTFRQDQQLPFGKIAAYSDGKTGWLFTPQGLMPMTPPVVKQVQGEVFRFLPRLLTADRREGSQVNAIDEKTIEITTATGDRVRLEIDPASGLPARELYTEGGMGAPPADIIANFSDWRDVSGVKMPFKTMIEQGGKKFAEITVTEYKFNTGLKADALAEMPKGPAPLAPQKPAPPKEEKK
jgi:zinc protease